MTVGSNGAMRMRTTELCMQSDTGMAHYANVNFWEERTAQDFDRGSVVLVARVNVGKRGL